MARTPLIDEARPTGDGMISLTLFRCPTELKRRLALIAQNEGRPMREVLIRGLALEVLRHPEAAGLTPDATTERTSV